MESSNLGNILEKLGDYLQKQCLERKIFNKSLFAFVDIDKLKNDNNPSIIPLFVTNQSDYTKNLSSWILLQVHNVSITDFNPKLMQWDESLESKFLNELKQYQKSSDNVYVMEIVLNNHLDFYHDGIYSHKDDLNIHIGTNVIGTTGRVFGVYYQWKVNIDYSIEIENIQVCK